MSKTLEKFPINFTRCDSGVERFSFFLAGGGFGVEAAQTRGAGWNGKALNAFIFFSLLFSCEFIGFIETIFLCLICFVSFSVLALAQKSSGMQKRSEIFLNHEFTRLQFDARLMTESWVWANLKIWFVAKAFFCNFFTKLNYLMLSWSDLPHLALTPKFLVSPSFNSQ